MREVVGAAELEMEQEARLATLTEARAARTGAAMARLEEQAPQAARAVLVLRAGWRGKGVTTLAA